MTPGRETEPLAAAIWRSRTDPSTEFARITYRGFEFEPHFHEHYVIMRVEQGVNLGRCGRQQYAAGPGEILVIEPGDTHTGSSLDSRLLMYQAFYPPRRSVERVLDRLGSRSDVPGLGLRYRDPGLGRAFRRLFRAVASAADEPMMEETALLEFFAALLVAQADGGLPPPKPRGDSARFRRAAAFIRDRVAERFSLDELAAASGTSPYYLIRLFRHHTGLTPFAYLRSLRVERARQLMRRGGTLTDVAHAAGFYDQSHFIRSFKGLTGFLLSDFSRHTGASGAIPYNPPHTA